MEVGDRITVRYLSGEQSVREITLSDKQNDPENGIVHIQKPLGRALIGAEKGEDIEILVGNVVRKAVVVDIVKNVSSNGTATLSEGRKNQIKLPFEQGDAHLVAVEKGPTHPALDPDRYYEKEYLLRVLRPYACDLIDRLGPITFRHLSDVIARAHGFQRTGSQIKQQVRAAVSKARRVSKTPQGGTIFWPQNSQPTYMIPFRGMKVNGEARTWQDISHPERLGLAIETLNSHAGHDPASVMANCLGLSRLRRSTRTELDALLVEARKHTVKT